MDALATDGLVAFAAFAVVGSFTPGPNTMLALATGARFGWRRVGPHALGVTLGFSTILALAAAGAAAVLLAVPAASTALRLAGVAWLLWLAWKVGRGGGPLDRGIERPFAAWQSALLQLVNAKGWMLGVAVAASWLGGSGATAPRAAVAVATFALTNVAAIYAWAGLGSSLQAWLAVGRRRARFDAAMGVALAASALAMLG
jgi:threonine/homoserine/homoserine lactone efflux protein